MKRIAIYARKSKFTGKGESIQNQINMGEEYAKTHFGDSEIQIYRDEGFSGGNTERPEFQRMMKDAKKNKFDILICYRLDRISRNVLDFSNTIEKLQKNNIDFISIKEQFDTSTPMGRAMMYISSVFAQLERETIAERLRDNMHKLARTGRWLGGKCPLGFESKPITYKDSNLNDKKMYKLSPVEDEIQIVKIIYNQYLKIGSLTGLQTYLIKNNIVRRNGNYYEPSGLKLILQNPVYCTADQLAYEYFIENNANVANEIIEFDGLHGLMGFNKHDESDNIIKKKSINEWIIAVAKHKGIIPSRDWIQVQKQLAIKKNTPGRAGTGVNLLTPLLVCKKCGAKLKVMYKKKDGIVKQHYYKCRQKEISKGHLCDSNNLNGQQAEKYIIAYLKNISNESSDLYKMLENESKKIKAETSFSEGDKKRLEKEIQEHEKQIGNLTLQLSQNENSTAAKYIIKQIESLDKKTTDLKNSIISMEKIKDISAMKLMNLDILKQSLRNFNVDFDNAPFEKKKKYIHEIVEAIYWDGENLDIKLREYN